jgi:hypothetical protein
LPKNVPKGVFSKPSDDGSPFEAAAVSGDSFQHGSIGEGDRRVGIATRRNKKLPPVFRAVHRRQLSNHDGLLLTRVKMPPALLFGPATERAGTAAERAGGTCRLLVFEKDHHLRRIVFYHYSFDMPWRSQIHQILIEFFSLHDFFPNDNEPFNYGLF